jgi:hypothetical protein
MEATLKNASERQQIIADRKRLTEQKHRLWVRDAWRQLDVYEVPVDALVLNADNRRFRAEKLWAEELLGRALDPENYPNDDRTIESLLLDSSHRVDGLQISGVETGDYASLKNDWLRRGQESPFWIRPDGIVRNGNRRLAMIKRLQREGGDTGLQWVQTVILDYTDIDEQSLLEMEQREQLTENLKVRYNDIDYLLALREAGVNRDIDWFDTSSIDQVAGELQTMVEKSKSEVVRDLYAIKYMDQFLEDSGQPGKYHKVLRTLERFRDIGRTMQSVEEEYPLDADQILQVLFAAVRSGQTHTDIREIRRMFRKDRNRFNQLSKTIEAAEASWSTSEQSKTMASPTPTEVTEADDDEDGEGPGPEVTNYPREEVSRAINNAIDAFATAQDADVLRILREITNRLAVLDEGNLLTKTLAQPGETTDTIRDELKQIIAWADVHRDLGGSS